MAGPQGAGWPASFEEAYQLVRQREQQASDNALTRPEEAMLQASVAAAAAELPPGASPEEHARAAWGLQRRLEVLWHTSTRMAEGHIQPSAEAEFLAARISGDAPDADEDDLLAALHLSDDRSLPALQLLQRSVQHATLYPQFLEVRGRAWVQAAHDRPAAPLADSLLRPPRRRHRRAPWLVSRRR